MLEIYVDVGNVKPGGFNQLVTSNNLNPLRKNYIASGFSIIQPWRFWDFSASFRLMMCENRGNPYQIDYNEFGIGFVAKRKIFRYKSEKKFQFGISPLLGYQFSFGVLNFSTLSSANVGAIFQSTKISSQYTSDMLHQIFTGFDIYMKANSRRGTVIQGFRPVICFNLNKQTWGEIDLPQVTKGYYGLTYFYSFAFKPAIL